jgi:phage antirepressor YoqD-like protein
MKELIKITENITSIELVKQINLFREQEGNRTELGHNDLLKIIRDEFEEEIGLGKISQSSYINSQNKEQPMFTLTISQGKQVLVRESKFVRKATIIYLEALEQKVKSLQPEIPQSYIGALEALIVSEKEKEKLQKQIGLQSTQIEFVKQVLDTEEKIDIGQCAKILELPFGRNTLFKKLREQGIFFKGKNEPKQVYIERGYFQLKEKWIDRKENDSFMIVKILVTQRGLGFLSTLFKSEPKSKINVQLN